MPAVEIPQDWLVPPSLKAATGLQRELAGRAVLTDDFGELRVVAGADISCNPRFPKLPIHAALAMLDWPSLAVTGAVGAVRPPEFPYVSGYLGFRECPALVEAYRELPVAPDLIFVDGQGVSHPRGFGVATHLGVLLDVPTVGVAKSKLCGEPVGELGPEPGDRVDLDFKGRIVGAMLRTKRKCKPLYISTGHRVSLDTAVDLVMQSLRGYRMPEPTRQAHIAANGFRRM